MTKPKAREEPEELILNIPDAKFGRQPDQILFIDDCRVGMGESPSAKLHIVGDVKSNGKETKSERETN